MEYKKFNDKIFLRIDVGEEIIENLKKICVENKITLGTVQGIGAASKATLNFFSRDKKEYFKKELDGEYEIVSFLGNITTKDGEVYIHIHACLGDEEFNSISGHLSSMTVGATFEGVIEITHGKVEREFDDKLGLNLFKF